MSWLAKFILLVNLLALPLFGSTATDNGLENRPDSTKVRTKQLIEPQLPTTQTNINATTGQQETVDSSHFATLPGCPGDPSRTQIPGSTWPTTPNCPSISGEWSIDANAVIQDPATGMQIFARTANCPATCTSTRITLPYKNARPTSVIEAVCPASYVAVAAYNMQTEYKSTNERTIAAPIFWNDYVRYKSQYYKCSANTPSNQGVDACPSADSATYATYRNRVTIGGIGVDDSDGPPTQDPNGYAGIWKPQTYSDALVSGYCYYKGANCAVKGAGNHVVGWPHPGQTGCTPTEIYNVRIKYDFYYYSCSITEGQIIQTSYQVPATVVCSRISTEWRSP